jgi:4-hydroxythreonine-4-phosphate dehydrogenase
LDAQNQGRGLRRIQALNAPPRIVLTTGEPAGIGPDISLALAGEALAARLTAIGDPDVLHERAARLGVGVDIEVTDTAGMASCPPHEPGRLRLLPVRCARTVTAGRLDPANATAVLEMLRVAAELCTNGQADAIVTAPVQKSVINDAGIPFSGHTELLAELTGAPLPVMMLASDELRVALATTHLPLRAVADAITARGLEKLIRVIDAELRAKLGLGEPRILVLGLNPHAGEGGTLGDEELTTIIPVVEKLTGEGLHIHGPVPADTAFTAESLARADIVLAMYHDQGLPVIKARGFGEIVNVTLGLPIVRTSVDHGTALGLAGTGRASHSSLVAATRCAIELVRRAMAERAG